MRTNGKIGMLPSFIRQYTIFTFIVTKIIAVNKPTFKCPDPSQWKFRAKTMCNDSEKYICLFDENGQRDEEFCGSWPDFENPGYKQILLGGTTRKPCAENRYQPFTFWTNGSSNCVYKKTSCTQDGQVVFNNGTARTDRTCRCDYTKNYDFQVKPRNNCFCVPTEEDCSCYVKHCLAGSRLTPDYECLDESKWKLSFFRCSEIKRDSINDKDEMPTIISIYGYETSSDSVALPSVLATVLCIAAVCVLVSTYLLIKHKDKFEMKQALKGKSEFKRKETSRIPDDDFDLQKKVKMIWRKRQKNFEVTHASIQVLNTMKSGGFVILSGPPGSGKSAIAYYTAFMLETNEKYKILPVSSPEEIQKYLLPETKQVFVIDDPVGKYSVDDSSIQRWKNEEHFIKETFRDSINTKLILTCRSYIYKSGFSRKLNFAPVHCDLLSYNLNLTFFERTNLCNRYKVPELNEDSIMMYNFFPLLCVDFVKNKDTAAYFINPIKILSEEMNNTKERSDIAFLAIALLIVQNNNIERKMLSLENNTTKELLNELCNECGFIFFPSTTVLLSALYHLIGTYLKETDDGFACIHETLFQNISFIVGSGIIHCLLKYGSSSFVANRLQLASIKEEHAELVLIVKPEQEELYFRRLLLDIKQGNHRIVFSGIQMKHSQFRIKLHTCLKSLKDTDITCDDDNSTPFHVVSEQGYDDFVFTLHKIKKDHINNQDNKKRTPLFMACLGGHDKVIHTILGIDNSSLHIADSEDLMPLDAASVNDHSSTVTLLLKKGANVNRKDKILKRTALQRACESGSMKVVKLLLTYKTEIKNPDSSGLKAIHIACQRGHDDIVELLLKFKEDMIDECDTQRRTPIFIACESNQQDTISMLIRYNADVNKTNIKRKSPLYIACKIGNVIIVGQLIDHSAKVNVQSDNGLSPLYIASMKGNNKCVEILLNKNANIHSTTKHGWTPFLISCSVGHLDICKLLYDNGANINAILCDKSARTPLHIACKEKHDHIVRFLLERGANANAVNRQKESPLFIACVNECFKIVELLLNNSADINLCEENGDSPIHVVCLKDNKILIQLLLDKKADIHKKNKAGTSPFDIVQGKKNDIIVDMFNRYKEKAESVNKIST